MHIKARINNVIKSAALLVLICFPATGHSMIYAPPNGAKFWDPSIIWHDGMYYAFSMYAPQGHKLWSNSIGLAVSRDGVHWEDRGPVITDDVTIVKCFVARRGDRFILNHGSFTGFGTPKQKQNRMRYFVSDDLIHWEHLYDDQPNPKFYDPLGRWDHMYMLPKKEADPSAGYWGYIVANPADRKGVCGMQESADGRRWTQLPPPEVDWGGVPAPILEIGGCERIGGKYYLIGGRANSFGFDNYGMFTLVSDSPRGPFRPDWECFRLCGTSGYHQWGPVFLAAFARGEDGEILVSNYLHTNQYERTYEVWMLPLRKAVVDSEGHLRLAYWPGNDAARGAKISAPDFTVSDQDGVRTSAGRDELRLEVTVPRNKRYEAPFFSIAMTDAALNLDRGVIVECSLRARSTGNHSAAGFVIEESSGTGVAGMLQVGNEWRRRSWIGRLDLGHVHSEQGDQQPTFNEKRAAGEPDHLPRPKFTPIDEVGEGCASVRGIDANVDVPLRIWIRNGIFEFYANDRLVQTGVYDRTQGTGRIGFVARNCDVTIKSLAAWQMNLDETEPQPKESKEESNKETSPSSSANAHLPRGAICNWQMDSVKDETGKHKLHIEGDVSFGSLAATDRKHSLARGGDGNAAQFNGGYLQLSDDKGFEFPQGQFSIAIRMRDPSGKWRYPILGSYGSENKVSLALRAIDGSSMPFESRNKGGAPVSTIYSWMFGTKGPRSIKGSSSLLQVMWGADKPDPWYVNRVKKQGSTPDNLLRSDVINGTMRICFPVEIIGPKDWHDIIVRFTGARLELWIDGLLVDVEYPIGQTRNRTLPFLIGAGHEDGQLIKGFTGEVDHVAIWDRALNEDEIVAMAGGAEHVARRKIAVLGEEAERMQYFRPRGHNRKAQDPIPYWDERQQTFRLFYLILRRNMHSKWDGGHGGLEIWQASTKDLKTWTHHPVTVPITEQWEAWNGTGACAFHDGQYHLFYPSPDYNADRNHSGVYRAVSSDGIHFAKKGRVSDIRVGDLDIYDDGQGTFHMLKYGGTEAARFKNISERTMVAWVRLSDLDQRKGGVLGIEQYLKGMEHDAISFGESSPRKWGAGSYRGNRTPSDQSSSPVETAGTGDVVQIANVYRGNTLTVYRNGIEYLTHRYTKGAEYMVGSAVVVGLPRSRSNADPAAYFHGSVLDARVFNRALSADEVKLLKPNADGGPTPLIWFDFARSGMKDRMGTMLEVIPFGDPKIENGELVLDGRSYLMAYSIRYSEARWTSPDLVQWTLEDKQVLQSPINTSGCENYFRFGDWYYHIGSQVWRRSKQPFGPWEHHQPLKLCNLVVPKTAAFGKDRRIYVGFLSDGGVAGNEVFRELVQDDEGRLGTRFLDEMIPTTGDEVTYAVEHVSGDTVNTVDRTLTLNGRGEVALTGIQGDVRIQLEVIPSEGCSDFGLELMAGSAKDSGTRLSFNTKIGTTRFTRMRDSGGMLTAPPVIEQVRNLDKPVSVDIVIRHDIIDVEIGRFRNITTRYWNPDCDRISLFSDGGKVTFKNIRVRRVIENYKPYGEAYHSRHTMQVDDTTQTPK